MAINTVPRNETLNLDAQFIAVSQCAILAQTDARGRITFLNDKFVEISGYTREELLGQDHRIVNSDYHPKSFFRDIWAAIQSGKPWRGEIRNRAKNGSIYWVDTVIQPILDDDGRPVGYWSVRFDITAKKAAETLARNTAIDLESSNVVRGEQARGLGLLADFAQSLVGFEDGHSLLVSAANVAAELLSCQYAAVFLGGSQDDPVAETPILHARSSDRRVHRSRLRQCVNRAIESRHLVVDPGTATRGSSAEESTTPITAAPLICAEEVIGAVCASHPVAESPLKVKSDLPYFTLLCNIVASGFGELTRRAQLMDTQDAVVRSMGTLAEYRDQETATNGTAVANSC